jgi:hypothetical protein
MSFYAFACFPFQTVKGWILPTAHKILFLNNKQTPWNRVLLEKLIVAQLVKKFHVLYGIKRFIAMFTIARHRFLS